jgi:2-iminobutanoate/2-iminopropanoate deaminase
MKHQAIQTATAPRAIGPYSQAIRAGELLFLSGQIPLDPATGELVSGGIDVQTRRVLDNLGAILQSAGGSFADVVKTTIYLVDLAEFAAMNAVYETYFAQPAPARATVQVAALPKGARIEIEAVAHLASASGDVA